VSKAIGSVLGVRKKTEKKKKKRDSLDNVCGNGILARAALSPPGNHTV
jgi:hypothetical protein